MTRAAACKDDGAVVVWFKNDLRLDDHVGVHKALKRIRTESERGASERPLVFFYCFDPYLLAPLLFTPAGPEVLVAAIRQLRDELRSAGSDLVVRTGPWEQSLADLSQQLGGIYAVVVEREVEDRWHHPMAVALNQLSAGSKAAGGPPVKVVPWGVSIWAEDTFHQNYRKWKQCRGTAQPPLDPPSQLPGPPAGLVREEEVPNSQQLRQMLVAAARQLYTGKLKAVADELLACTHEGDPAYDASIRLAEEAQAALSALRAYLAAHKDSEGLAFISEAAQAIQSPAAEGYSFPALFNTSLSFGTLSRRRVHHEASRVARTTQAQAALAASESADFHWLLACRSLPDEPVAGHEEEGVDSVSDVAGPALRSADPWEGAGPLPEGVRLCHWRWRGCLTDYCVMEPTNPLPNAPAFLLVHGFGAFGSQWRGIMAGLAAAGFRVFAPTFPGFGRAEKPSVPYSQDIWGGFLRDFILQVVQQPVVLAGNSIGGFISASLAADCPPLVSGLVLLNSAGPIDAKFDIASWREAADKKKAPPKIIVQTVSALLFWYLERTISGTLKWLYPTDPSRADAWLEEEIFRAACDAGAIDVFKAVFYLPPPRALNYLVAEAYKGPALVLQGALDPLNDAKGRAAQMRALCGNLDVSLLDAGHCPHDEVPDQVTQQLLTWVTTRVMSQAAAATAKEEVVATS